MPSARFSQETLHPLLAAVPAIAFVFAALSLVSDVFGVAAPGALYLLPLIGAAVVEIVVGSLLRRERAQQTHRLREFVLLVGASYLLLALFRPEPLTERFLPDTALGLRVAGCAVVWLLTLQFHAGFLAREDLLKAAGGKAGEELRRDMRETQGFATSILREMHGVKSTGAFMLCLLAFGYVLTHIHGSAISAATILATLLYALSYLIVVAIVNLFLEEFTSYGEGLPVAARFLRKRAYQLLIVAAAAGIVASLASSNRALLSLAFLEAVGTWLSNLFASPSFADVSIPRPPIEQLSPSVLFGAAQELDAPRPSPFWSSFVQVLKWAFFSLAGLAGIAFLIWPFLTRRFRNALLTMHPWEAIKRRAVRTVLAIWHAWRFIRLKLRRRRRPRYVTAAEELPERYRFPSSSRRSALYRARKNIQSATLLREYRSVIEWCAEHRVDRHRFETVREHGERMAERYPGLRESMGTIIDVVERAVFSDELVDGKARRAYREAVREVLGRP